MSKTPQRLKDFRSKKCRKEIYFSPHDMKEFERIAKAEGTTSGLVIRNMALAYLQNRRDPSQQELQRLDNIYDEVTKLSLLIRNIANNINQVAHRSNTLKTMLDEHDLLLHLKQLDELVRDSVDKQINGADK